MRLQNDFGSIVFKAYMSNFVINPPIRVCVEAHIKTKVSLSAIENKNPIKLCMCRVFHIELLLTFDLEVKQTSEYFLYY